MEVLGERWLRGRGVGSQVRYGEDTVLVAMTVSYGGEFGMNADGRTESARSAEATVPRLWRCLPQPTMVFCPKPRTLAGRMRGMMNGRENTETRWDTQGYICTARSHGYAYS